MTDREFLQWVRILNEETDTDDRSCRQFLAHLLDLPVRARRSIDWVLVDDCLTLIWRQTTRR